MSIYAQKCHLFTIECDSNLLDGKSHLGIIQLNLGFIKFSFLCDMNESSSRFGTPKTFDEEKDCLSILFQNLRLHEQIGDFSRMARPKSAQDLHHLARRGLFKGEDLGWMFKS